MTLVTLTHDGWRDVPPAEPSRRYGRFSIPNDIVKDHHPLLRQVMGKCVIYRAECMLHRDEVEYLAWSPEFEPIAVGERAKDYVWHVSADGTEVHARLVTEQT